MANRELTELLRRLERFEEALGAIRQYIGARYVPKFIDDPWTDTQEYENLSVVTVGGTSYIAGETVPVGTPISDRNYWHIYGASSGAIINLQNQIDNMNDGDVPGSLQNQIDDNSSEIQALTNIVNTPQKFGAIGDGVTDDTQALQDAINASYGGTLIIPYGRYKISAPLVIEKAINIIGYMGAARSYRAIDTYVAPYSTIFTDSIIDSIFIIRSDYVTLKFLSIQCNDKSACGVKTDTYYYTRINLENVHVDNATDCGFKIYSYILTLKLCTSHSANNYGFYLGGTAGMTGTTIESCYADGSAIGWYILKYEYSAVIACAADNVGVGYQIDSCKSLTLLNCGIEGVDNPVIMSGSNNNIQIMGLCAEGLNLVNGVNDNGAVIYCSDVIVNFVMSGLRMTQDYEYKGYKIKVANGSLIDNITLLDDSIKYAEISVPSAFTLKSCVNFPNKRSLLNGKMTLNTSTVGNSTVTKIHEGQYEVVVNTVDASAPVDQFNLGTVTLPPGIYMIKGTELDYTNSSVGLIVATTNYGSGVIARDRGETATFTINADTLVYVSIESKPTALRTKKYLPEIIKIE